MCCFESDCSTRLLGPWENWAWGCCGLGSSLGKASLAVVSISDGNKATIKRLRSGDRDIGWLRVVPGNENRGASVV